MVDFASWKQENLVAYATEVSEENRVLREDNRLLLAAWRRAVTGKYLGEVPDELPAHPSPPRSVSPAPETPSAGQI